MAQPLILSSPNRADADFYTVSFSGGSWEASLPLTNLRDPLLSAVARSTDATNASTQFVVDLGVPRDIRLVACPDGNYTRDSRVRITGATDSGFTDVVVTVDFRDIWQEVYPWGTLPWEDLAWWDGKITAEDAVGYPMPFIHVFDTAVVARYWKIEIDDEGNPDGYVELSRLFLSPGYQPTHNAEYGATIGWETDTSRQRSLGGADFYDERRPRRRMRLTLNAIEMDELYAQMFEIQRRQGISRQIYVVLDPDDGPNLHRTSFLATLEELSPIELAFYDRGVVAVDLVEVIA